MTKEQRVRYEMFVRVRDFGVANRALFPEVSAGRAMFDTVTSSVAAIEDQLTRRDLARAESQRVNVTTRRAVNDAMRAIAHTARRITRAGSGVNPFRMPARKSSAAILSKARLFAEQAALRQEEFIHFGLPPTFVSDLRKGIDELEQAVEVRLNSRSQRHLAQRGIENALTSGFSAILDLDAIVANALRLDPVRLAGWQGARHIEGATPAPAMLKKATGAASAAGSSSDVEKVS